MFNYYLYKCYNLNKYEISPRFSPPLFWKKPHLYGIKYFHWYLKPLSHPMLHTVLFSLFLYFWFQRFLCLKWHVGPGCQIYLFVRIYSISIYDLLRTCLHVNWAVKVKFTWNLTREFHVKLTRGDFACVSCVMTLNLEIHFIHEVRT